MSLTLSEQLFQAFCKSKNIRYRRVATADTRRPDYEIFVPRRKVVVDVKEISPNAAEREAWQDLKKRKFAVVSATPGGRVRHKIANAVPQIKARSKGRFPGLLVLMDTGFAAEHASPYNVRVAMYGFETLILAVPSDLTRRPYLTDKKFGAVAR